MVRPRKLPPENPLLRLWRQAEPANRRNAVLGALVVGWALYLVVSSQTGAPSDQQLLTRGRGLGGAVASAIAPAGAHRAKAPRGASCCGLQVDMRSLRQDPRLREKLKLDDPNSPTLESEWSQRFNKLVKGEDES